MAALSNVWTPSLKAEFHQSVAELRKRTEVPSEIHDYRSLTAPESHGHVLSFRDELQIADGLAFLSHWDEGADRVSTVTLQEHPGGLTVLLACNKPPDASIIRSLEEVFTVVSYYVSRHGESQAFLQALFREVLELSKRRILCRIRPRWVDPPSHIRNPRPTLQARIQNYATVLQNTRERTEPLQVLLDKTRELIDALDPLNSRIKSPDMDTILEAIIRKCAEIAELGTSRSLRDHLYSLRLPPSVCEAQVVHQIDKLARYLFFCKDLVHVAKSSKYKMLFKHVEIAHMTAFPGFNRPGIDRGCFVHAEVQQVLHYERHPHHPAPRAIGCSKSACYLCDLFVRTQGRYRLSHAHRRLYEKWTIPDVDWMTEEQTAAYRQIIHAMIRDIRECTKALGRNTQCWKSYPLESRAFLPLSSRSSLSKVTTGVGGGDTDTRKAVLPGEKESLTYIKLTVADLPLLHAIRAGQPPLMIELGRLSLCFEFTPSSAGHLSLIHVDDSSTTTPTVLAIEDIPTDNEMQLKSHQQPPNVSFCVRIETRYLIKVEFRWEN